MKGQTAAARFAQLPISRQTMIMATASTVIALLVLSAMSLGGSYVLTRRNLQRELGAQATVLAESASAAVAFGDQALADQIARAVNGHWRIDAVCIYDETGRLFASSIEAGHVCDASAPATDGTELATVRRSIMVGGRQRGSVVVGGNFDNLYGFTAVQSGVTAAALLIGLALALRLTQRLRSSIVTPIGELAHVADRIAKSGDYSLRTTSATSDEIGDMSQAFNTMLDVVERSDRELQRAVRDLRASQARWRAIVDCATDAIVVIDTRGRIEAFNPAAERLFGFREADVLGSNVKMLMPAPYRDEHDDYLGRYASTGEAQVIGIGRDVTGRHQDGHTFPLRLAVGEMAIDDERKFVGILHDLTERLDLEKRLRDQAALTKLGEMAAVFAHEVKNPIAGVRGAIQIIGSRLPPASTDAAIVGEIVKRLDVLNGLMQDVLLYARPREPRLESVDLKPLLHDVAVLVQLDPLHAHLQIDIAGAAPPLQADGELLKIAVQNLVINSAHALNGRGQIGITLASDDTARWIVIEDNGPGIPAEVRARLFTPFFTTKARGTGLGLATAKRFVEAHRGTLTVECPARGGTTMTIHLPAEAS